MQRLIFWLNSRSKLWVVGAGLVGTAMVGLIDYLTGPEVRVSILYVLVVIFVTWLAGTSCGVFGAAAAAIPAAERIFGYRANDVGGQGSHLLMPPPSGDEHDHHIHDYLLAGQHKVIGVSREIVGRRKSCSAHRRMRGPLSESGTVARRIHSHLLSGRSGSCGR
jgi:hypothetical protein